MERHTRYLELRLAQCTPRPELHRHQIPVLRELIELSRSGISPPEYNRRAGHLFGLIRAEWLDRYDNLAGLHTALADDRMRKVAETARLAGDARDFAELAASMSRAMTEAGGLALAATTAVDSLAPLLITLLHWATDADPNARAVLAETSKGLWRAIQHNDPGCSWQRICSWPPYRNRLPFGDDGLALIGSWLHRAVGTQLAAVPSPPRYDPGPLPVIETPDAPALPSIQDAARGYHAAYDHAKQHGAPRVLAIYERIFELEGQATCVNDFLCKLTADDLICELSRAHFDDVASDALAHCAGLSQPLVEFHYDSLVAGLRRAASSTEIDYEIARHELCFAVESAWHQIFVAYVFRTITTAMAYEFDPSEDRRTTLQNSAAVTEQLFGDWDTTFAIPRVWEFFSSVFLGPGREPAEPAPLRGVYRGEVGTELLTAFRFLARPPAIELEPAESPGPFSTPEQLRDHITGLFHAAMAGKTASKVSSASANRGVILWGQAVSFEALEGMMSSPPRPC